MQEAFDALGAITRGMECFCCVGISIYVAANFTRIGSISIQQPRIESLFEGFKTDIEQFQKAIFGFFPYLVSSRG